VISLLIASSFPGVEQIHVSERSSSNAGELAKVPIRAIITRPVSA
jgi:hypothetical protein